MCRRPRGHLLLHLMYALRGARERERDLRRRRLRLLLQLGLRQQRGRLRRRARRRTARRHRAGLRGHPPTRPRSGRLLVVYKDNESPSGGTSVRLARYEGTWSATTSSRDTPSSGKAPGSTPRAYGAPRPWRPGDPTPSYATHRSGVTRDTDADPGPDRRAARRWTSTTRGAVHVTHNVHLSTRYYTPTLRGHGSTSAAVVREPARRPRRRSRGGAARSGDHPHQLVAADRSTSRKGPLGGARRGPRALWRRSGPAPVPGRAQRSAALRLYDYDRRLQELLRPILLPSVGRQLVREHDVVLGPRCARWPQYRARRGRRAVRDDLRRQRRRACQRQPKRFVERLHSKCPAVHWRARHLGGGRPPLHGLPRHGGASHRSLGEHRGCKAPQYSALEPDRALAWSVGRGSH